MSALLSLKRNWNRTREYIPHFKKEIPVVRTEWITQCISKQRMVPWQDYVFRGEHSMSQMPIEPTRRTYSRIASAPVVLRRKPNAMVNSFLEEMVSGTSSKGASASRTSSRVDRSGGSLVEDTQSRVVPSESDPSEKQDLFINWIFMPKALMTSRYSSMTFNLILIKSVTN